MAVGKTGGGVKMVKMVQQAGPGIDTKDNNGKTTTSFLNGKLVGANIQNRQEPHCSSYRFCAPAGFAILPFFYQF